MRRRYLVIAIVCFLLSLWALSGVASAQTQEAPKWAVALAASGPLADGVSTYYALQQPDVREANQFYARLFGSDVTPGEILAVKVAQAAVFGAVVHAAGKQHRKAAIGVAILTASIHFAVSAWNVSQAHKARGRR